MMLDFPTLGYPTRPTSASSFNSRRSHPFAHRLAPSLPLSQIHHQAQMTLQDHLRLGGVRKGETTAPVPAPPTTPPRKSGAEHLLKRLRQTSDTHPGTQGSEESPLQWWVGTWGCRVVAPDLRGWVGGGPRPDPPSGGHRLKRLECASVCSPRFQPLSRVLPWSSGMEG